MIRLAILDPNEFMNVIDDDIYEIKMKLVEVGKKGIRKRKVILDWIC